MWLAPICSPVTAQRGVDRQARLRGEVAGDAAARVAARAAAGGNFPPAWSHPAGGCEVAVDAGEARAQHNPTGPQCSRAARSSAARGDRKTRRHAQRPACWIGPYRPLDARQTTHGGHRRRATKRAMRRATSVASRRAESGHREPPARGTEAGLSSGTLQGQRTGDDGPAC